MQLLCPVLHSSLSFASLVDQLKTALVAASTRLQDARALEASLAALENASSSGAPGSPQAAAAAAFERARQAIAKALASVPGISARPASFDIATGATIDALKRCTRSFAFTSYNVNVLAPYTRTRYQYLVHCTTVLSSTLHQNALSHVSRGFDCCDAERRCEQYAEELAELVNRTTHAAGRALAGVEAARAVRTELVDLRYRLLDQCAATSSVQFTNLMVLCSIRYEYSTVINCARRFERHVRQLNETRVEFDLLAANVSELEIALATARAKLAALRQMPYDDARVMRISQLIVEVRADRTGPNSLLARRSRHETRVRV